MINNGQKETYQSIVRAVKLLPSAMIAGLGLMSVVLILIRRGEEPNGMLGDAAVIGVALFAAAMVVLSSYLYRRTVGTAMGKNLAEKLVIYRSAVVLRFAIIEGPALFSAVLYFLSGNYIFMVITGCLFVFMLLNRPTDEMIAEHLMLTEEDKRKL